RTACSRTPAPTRSCGRSRWAAGRRCWCWASTPGAMPSAAGWRSWASTCRNRRCGRPSTVSSRWPTGARRWTTRPLPASPGRSWTTGRGQPVPPPTVGDGGGGDRRPFPADAQGASGLSGRGDGGAPGRRRIAARAGDGIGPEVTAEAVRVLKAVSEPAGVELVFEFLPFGGAAVDQEGDPLPPATERACLDSDAVLLGAVGGPRWDAEPPQRRPEAGLL